MNLGYELRYELIGLELEQNVGKNKKISVIVGFKWSYSFNNLLKIRANSSLPLFTFVHIINFRIMFVATEKKELTETCLYFIISSLFFLSLLCIL